MDHIKFASIIVTYRCNARCQMCNTWRYPSLKQEEIGIDVYAKLPFMGTLNITGGEPFVRDDIDEIVACVKRKTRRIVISTNGYFTDRILEFFSKNKDVGVRISIEGLPSINDKIRGLKDGFERGIRTLVELNQMGVKDIGFGITICDDNSKDMLDLFYLAKMMGVEFATAAIHNSFYFHKYDNHFIHPEIATDELRKLIGHLLKSKKIKDWFRAYFNYGLINYINSRPRLLPCEMGFDSFFLDPYGYILPCNVLEQKMGNLVEQSFEEIWDSQVAQEIRKKVESCEKNCWMIGSVSQQMKKYFWIPSLWILKHKYLKRRMLN